MNFEMELGITPARNDAATTVPSRDVLSSAIHLVKKSKYGYISANPECK